MALDMKYQVTVTCDTCGKVTEYEYDKDHPPADPVPEEWVHAQPSGEQLPRQFCSIKCLGKWKPPKKPWEEE